MPSHDTQLVLAFANCISRGATKQQLQDFVDRARENWKGNAAMLVVVESLQNQID